MQDPSLSLRIQIYRPRIRVYRPRTRVYQRLTRVCRRRIRLEVWGGQAPSRVSVPGVPGLGTVTTRAETFLARRLATFAAAGGPHRGPGRFSQQGVCCLARRHGLLAWPRGQGLHHNAAAGIRRPPSLR